MNGLLTKVVLVRAIAASVFLIMALVLIGQNFLREPMASMSPASRNKTILAAQLSRKDLTSLGPAARSFALQDPLLAAPFILLGVERLAKDQDAFDRVRPLMQTALARQPTLGAPQAWLAADAARRGDYRGAMDLFDRALSQDDDYAAMLMPALSTMLKNSTSREAVLRKLREFPRWRAPLLTEIINTKALPDNTIEALLAGPVAPQHAAASESERLLYVAAVARRGETERAHRLYRGYAGLSAENPLHDGRFLRSQPFLPFGWKLASGTEDYAERLPLPDAGWVIRAHSSGRRAAILLEQTLALSPGNWQIRLDARDAGLARPENMVLRVKCLAVGTVVAEMPLNKLMADFAVTRLNLAVPADCALQQLAIASHEASDDRQNSASEIEIRSVAIIRVKS